MSVHTFRQRSALQRAQQRWQYRRRSHLHLVQPSPAAPTVLERLNDRLWRIHDSSWPWLIVGLFIVAADVCILASMLPWWHV